MLTPGYLLFDLRSDPGEHVEVSEQLFENADEVKVLQNTERRIVKDIKDYLGVSAKVKLVEPKSLQRFEGKVNRVQDRRHI